MKNNLFPLEFAYVAKIKYNATAKAMIKRARDRGLKLRIRGSGSRSPFKRKDGKDLRRWDQSLPLKYATHVRVYCDSLANTNKASYDVEKRYKESLKANT